MLSIKNVSAQAELDSLKHALINPPNDTARAVVLFKLSEMAPENEWPKYNNDLRIFCEAKLSNCKQAVECNFFKKYLAYAYNNTGIFHNQLGDIKKALEFYTKSLEIFEELKYKQGISSTLINLAFVYKNQGDIKKGLEYYSRSLKISEEIGDRYTIATTLNNMSGIYQDLGDIPKALDNIKKSLAIRKEINDEYGVATCYNNLGVIYNDYGNPSEALDYYTRALEIQEKILDKPGLAISLNNIGNLFYKKGDPFCKGAKEECMRAGIQNALLYFEKGLKIQKEIGDVKGMAISLSNLSAIYLQKRNYEKALEMAKKGLALSMELGYPERIKNQADVLTDIYRGMGNYRAAIESYELYIEMRDSLNNEATRKASIKTQLKYEYDKKAATDSVSHAKENLVKNAELAQHKAEIQSKRGQQYVLVGGLILVVVFSGFMYNRFRVTQKQKKIIEEKERETQKQNELISQQKHLVEEKQKEILDSIMYARRIQRALITNEKYIDKSLKKLKSENS